MRKPTYYEELEVIENASPEAIKGAYKHLAQKWHPDKNLQNIGQATAALARINRAYYTLSNSVLKKAYDSELRQDKSFRRAGGPERGEESTSGFSARPQSNEGAGRTTRSNDFKDDKRNEDSPSVNEFKRKIGDRFFGFIFIGLIYNLAVLMLASFLVQRTGGELNADSYLINGVPWYVVYLGVSLFASMTWPKCSRWLNGPDSSRFRNIVGSVFGVIFLCFKLYDFYIDHKASKLPEAPATIALTGGVEQNLDQKKVSTSGVEIQKKEAQEEQARKASPRKSIFDEPSPGDGSGVSIEDSMNRAGAWKEVGAMRNESSVVYVDENRLILGPGQVKDFYLLLNVDGFNGDQRVKSIVVPYTMSCGMKSVKKLQAYVYSAPRASGIMLSTKDPSTPYKDVAAGTIFESLYQLLCNG